MRRNLNAPTAYKNKRAMRLDAVFTALLNATPTQIDNWVDNNVATVADCRKVLKVVLKAVQVLAKRGNI